MEIKSTARGLTTLGSVPGGWLLLVQQSSNQLLYAAGCSPIRDAVFTQVKYRSSLAHFAAMSLRRLPYVS